MSAMCYVISCVCTLVSCALGDRVDGVVGGCVLGNGSQIVSVCTVLASGLELLHQKSKTLT